ncbi:MAG TPA: PAS domain S-box protein, partial [Deltaproteobacteria bacterium]|nr:PAS domain S-box protein [Deltaproteobacteria bacterium]
MKSIEQPQTKGLPPGKPIALIIILAIFSLGVFIAVYEHWMDSLYEQVELQQRQNLIQVVSLARNAVEPVLRRVRSGEISPAEALKQIRLHVRTMTYTDQYGKNYIFMSSYDGTMLVQPFEPQKELTNQWDLRDVHGRYIIRSLVQAARSYPAGSFVRYYYYLPGVHAPQEKLAYVVGLPELQCYIGTGMYMQQAIREQREILSRVQYSAIGLLLVVLIPVTAAILIILNRNRLLLKEVMTRRRVETELKNSEAKFRSIFENAVEGIYQSAPDGRLINVNPALAHAVGYESAREMIESGIGIDYYYVDNADRERLVQALHEKGVVKDYVLRLKRRDGSIAWAKSNAHVIRDEQGNILYYEGSVEDISARREAEQTVRRLAAVVRHSRELVNLAEMDGRMVFLNETGSAMLGIDQDEVETTTIMQVVPGQWKDLLEREVLPALEKAGGNWEGDLQYVNLKTGALTDVHALFFTIDDPEAGDRRYLVNISLDVSRHKQAEDKFMKVFMLAPDGIVITRMRDGLIIDTNLGFEEISGWKRGEAITRTSLELNFWADPADRVFLTEELKAGRDVLQREFRFRRRDGTVREGIYSARSIQIGGELCLVFVVRDITDRRRLEDDRRKLELQLHHSQKMDAIGQLAGGVAHDFNNILTGIQGNASLMKLDYDPEHPHYHRLSQIEEQVVRGANLTRQLLGFARGGKSEVKTVSVNELIRKTAQFFLETRRDIKADLGLDDGIFTVEADAGQIEQVLLNLFINAGHAMPKGGELSIRTTKERLSQAEAKAFETSPGDYV